MRYINYQFIFSSNTHETLLSGDFTCLLQRSTDSTTLFDAVVAVAGDDEDAAAVVVVVAAAAAAAAAAKMSTADLKYFAVEAW